MTSRLIRFGFASLLLVSPLLVYAQGIPTGVPIDLNNIIDISQGVGGFLITVGEILASIAIIAAGVAYLTAGGDANKIKTAKGILFGGIIGALIIFGSGIIVNTLKNFAGKSRPQVVSGLCKKSNFIDKGFYDGNKTLYEMQ